MARRIAADRRYARHLRERFGLLNRAKFGTKPSGIWLHAVSVGEVLSAAPLLTELRRRLPETGLFVSVTTLTGRDLAERRLAPLCDGIFYAPFDTAFAVRATLRCLQPALFVNLETELWPNRFRELHRAGIKVAQANARISDKAWPAYQRLAWFWRSVLSHVDWLGVQSEKDLARFRALGYAGSAADLGNLKFDFEPPRQAPAPELLAWLQASSGPLLIAASTVGRTAPDDLDEEDAILDALPQLPSNLRLLLAPRKPERFPEVAAKLAQRNLAFARRSQLSQSTSARILLLDTLGELSPLFAYADLVFVGGSLCRWGGHNVLEPASFGKPILVGPHMQNFADIYARFAAAQALITLPGSAAFAAQVQSLLNHPGEVGQKAAKLSTSLRGVSARLCEHLVPLLDEGLPRVHLPLAALGQALKPLWLLGASHTPSPRTLPIPVISIGNLSMGGTGKTPVALALAEALSQRGYRVAILTRGYRRQSQEDLIFLPGQFAPWTHTGDEAQEYLAAATYAVGIGRNRYAVGQNLLNQYPADIILLDDGFQHRKLSRQFDLVLLDASLPFPGGNVPPVGLLREPLSHLERAHAFLLTRTEPGRTYDALRRLLPPRTPTYQSTPSYSLSNSFDPADAIAFCGLGNPAGFRNALQQLGLGHLELVLFPDHHSYSAQDIGMLFHRHRFGITTRKDAVKLKDQQNIITVNLSLKLPEELIHQILEKALLPPQRPKAT
ncbi:MAG: tetraacyldisaccharide 4'-kinase [Bryobacter sp.]|nr:tetraacyldisaccharide 4'-kinase [Bryobacter sp.]